MPRLARLSAANMKLAEEFLLLGGNMKDLSLKLDISYPTLRKHVDAMIAELADMAAQDRKRISSILDAMEAGEMKAEKGLRLIREINGE